MRKVNAKSDMDALAMDTARVQEALKKLKSAQGFGEYQDTLKSLYKSIVLEVIQTKVITPQAVNRVAYLQAQLDLLATVFSITYDSVINELINETFEEPAG